METIIPLHGDMGRILNGVVVDLKNVPSSMINRLQLHFADGESTDISPEVLAQIIASTEIDGSVDDDITAIEVNLDLAKLETTIKEVSGLMSHIIQDELKKYDNSRRD